MRKSFSIAMLAAVVAGVVSTCVGGVVQTQGARLAGDVSLGQDKIKVGGQAIRWDEVICVCVGPKVDFNPAQAVKLSGGDIVFGNITGAGDKKVTIESSLLGAREISIGQAISIEFAPGVPQVSRPQAGTLYRQKGEPVGGDLLRMDARTLTIEGPQGVVTIEREGCVRYVFAISSSRPASASAIQGDEVTLMDGSSLSGKITPKVDGLELAHAILGNVTIPYKAIASIMRHCSNVQYLAQTPPESVAATAIVSPEGPTQTIDFLQGDLGAYCLRGIRILPQATVNYVWGSLPGKSVFRTTLQPIEGAQGEATVRISSGGKVLAEVVVGPGSGPTPISLELPDANDLSIEVSFADRLKFPCGVILGDPLLIFPKAAAQGAAVSKQVAFAGIAAN